MALTPGSRLGVYEVTALLGEGGMGQYLFDTRGGQTRLTDGPSDDFSPVWSPHGDRLAFAGRRQGDQGLNLYATNVTGTGGAKRLLDLDGVEIPTSWSRDEFLLFQTPSPGADIKVLSLADGQVSSLASTQFREGSAQFSPDGRWVAYSSDETGRTEVYGVPFQRAGQRVPISTDGGGSPRWRHDSKELFYLRGDNTLMAVAVSLKEASVDVGAASPLFQSRFGSENFPYAVTSDGRFLVNRSVDDETPSGIRRQLAGYAAEGLTFRVTGRLRQVSNAEPLAAALVRQTLFRSNP